jgi:ABC-type multidrug transport system fused ATPase/permease subunit
MRNKDKKDDNKKGKKKKKKVSDEKKYGTDLQLLNAFYKIDLEKIGVLRTLKILNIVNPFVLSLLVVLVYPIKQIWLKLIVLMLIILPVVWFTYYFVAKYLRRIERKSNNV